MRTVSQIYQDPLDVIWIHAAAQMGMRIERDDQVFAAWDGRGELRIGFSETLDPDDSLAQMILHEICHALVEGPAAFELPDWGVEIDNPEHRVREHACLRLQAALTAPFGLRQFFAATTNFRRYYDQLADDALEDDGDPAVPLATAGMERAQSGPWSQPISRALQLTSQIAQLIRPIASPESLWAVTSQHFSIS